MSPNIFWLDIPHLAFWHQTMIKFSTAIKALSEVSWDGGEQWSKCCKGWNFWHSVRNLLWKLETSRCSWIIRSTQGEKKILRNFHVGLTCWVLASMRDEMAWLPAGMSVQFWVCGVVSVELAEGISQIDSLLMCLVLVCPYLVVPKTATTSSLSFWVFWGHQPNWKPSLNQRIDATCCHPFAQLRIRTQGHKIRNTKLHKWTSQ